MALSVDPCPIRVINSQPAWYRMRAFSFCRCRALNLALEKPWIECKWGDRRNRDPRAIRVPVIDQHIAIGRASGGHDDGRDHENESGAFIEPCIPEFLRVRLTRAPVIRQIAKRYRMRRNIIRDGVRHHGLRR